MSVKFNFSICFLLILVGCVSIAYLVVARSSLNANAQTAQKQGDQSLCCDYWAPNWLQTSPWQIQRESKDMQSRMQRHWVFMHGGIPELYRRAQSNFDPTKQVIEEGRKLYS